MERRLCRLAAAALAAAAICAAGPAFGAQSARVIFDGVLLGAVSQKGWIDAETLQEIGTLTGHSNTVNSANYSPDGMHIVTTSGNVKKCAVGRHPKSEMLTICAC